MGKKRTEAHKSARLAAENKDISLERLTNNAISSGIFAKGDGENFSLSWVNARLRSNDLKVAKKLIEFAATI